MIENYGIIPAGRQLFSFDMRPFEIEMSGPDSELVVALINNFLAAVLGLEPPFMLCMN